MPQRNRRWPKTTSSALSSALTGTYAWVGVPSREGLDVGIEDVNASGMLGGNILRVLIEDTASDKTQAISLINRFSTRDKALIVLGPSSSSEGVAIAPVANELKIPLLSTTAVSQTINKSGPWVFKTPASPALGDRRRSEIRRREDEHQKRRHGMGPQQ